jgi:hypothetical protein
VRTCKPWSRRTRSNESMDQHVITPDIIDTAYAQQSRAQQSTAQQSAAQHRTAPSRHTHTHMRTHTVTCARSRTQSKILREPFQRSSLTACTKGSLPKTTFCGHTVAISSARPNRKVTHISSASASRTGCCTRAREYSRAERNRRLL